MKKGYSLFEILIAAAIFAVVMVITAGVIGQMSGFNKKIRAERDVNEDARKIADQISADIRSAVGVDKTTCSAPKYGLALLNCDNSTYWSQCIATNMRQRLTGGGDLPDTLVIRTKDYVKAYHSDANSKIFYKSWKLADFGCDNASINLSDVTQGAVTYRLSRGDVDTTIDFAGIMVISGNTYYQPYVEFLITSRTTNYDSLTVYERAETVIRSAITARGYVR